jgi:hypothetical protein
LLGNDDGTFQNAVNYVAGVRPYSVSIGDLDGDGDLDLAVANDGSDNVSVLPGNGDGTFNAAVYDTGDWPTSVSIGDLDGDGDLDLAVANGGSDNVSVLLGNGDSTFQKAENYGAGDWPTSVSIGDLDGDGDLDLAVANGGNDNVSVLLGNGDGTFQDAVNYGAGDQPYSVSVADLDGDGDMDLAIANFNNASVSVLLGNGDGSFQDSVNYGAGNGPYSVSLGDLDGDGDMDLALANWVSNNVSVLLGNGDGTFQNAVNYVAGDLPSSISIGDLDGDGDLDLAVANGISDNVSVLLGNGDGTFQGTVNYGTGVRPESVSIGDLDWDGDLDLAISNKESDNVSVLLGNGDGTFQKAQNYSAGDGPSSVSVGDLDGDGDLDLAVTNRLNDNASVLINMIENVSVSLVPDSIGLPREGTLGYNVTVTNNTSSTQCFDYWTNITLPNGYPFPASGTLIGPYYLCLGAFETRSEHLTLSIPVASPLGTYTYNGLVGPYPKIWDEDNFGFVIQSDWSQVFGGFGNDWGRSVRQTAEGGFIITGRTLSFGVGGWDVYLVKTDSVGGQEWSVTFGGSSDDFGQSVQQTTDGGFIIVGYTYSAGIGGSDVYLIKADKDGNEIWSRTFGGSNADFGFSLCQTNDGGFVIAGYTYSFGSGWGDIYLIKTDSDGNEQWSRTFGGSDGDFGYSVTQTTDGGYIIAGYTYSFGEGSSDIYLIKTDGDGNEQWSRTFGGSDGDFGYSVTQATDGGYIIAGYTYSFGEGGSDIYLIKTSSDGGKEWYRTFGGSTADFGYSVQPVIDGGYIVAGYTYSFGEGGSDVYLVKIKANGNREWSWTFGGSGNDFGYSVQPTVDRGFIVAGRTNSFSNGDDDLYLIYYNRGLFLSATEREGWDRK